MQIANCLCSCIVVPFQKNTSSQHWVLIHNQKCLANLSIFSLGNFSKLFNICKLLAATDILYVFKREVKWICLKLFRKPISCQVSFLLREELVVVFLIKVLHEWSFCFLFQYFLCTINLTFLVQNADVSSSNFLQFYKNNFRLFLLKFFYKDC